MKLIRSTALVICTTFAVLAISLYSAFQFFVFDKFREVERAEMQADIERAVGMIQRSLEALTVKAVDWAQWDATFQFMEDRNRRYFQENLISQTLEAIDIDHVLYLDPAGNVIEAREYLRGEGIAVSMNSAAAKRFVDAPSLWKHEGVESRISGLLRLGDRVFLAAAVPITNSARSKPSAGTLIFTREISPRFLQSVAETTRLDLFGIFIGTTALQEQDERALADLQKGSNLAVHGLNQNTILGYGLIRDLRGAPVLLLRIREQRDILQRGIESRNFLALCLALSTLACVFVALLFLRRRVLAPLAAVGGQMRNIAGNNDTSQRIALKGKDELARLASDINLMLQSLDTSKRALEGARDAAEAANRAKSLFVAKVSHELRTPLHTVTSMQTILLNSETSPVKRTHLRIAQEAALALASSINDILDFSKVESGTLSVTEVEYGVRETVREALRLVAPRFVEQPNVELVCNVTRAVPECVNGDPQRIRQVLINLLSNAVKFTASGFVRLEVDFESAELEEPRLILRVTDSGIGIAKEHLSRIFEPFQQADESVTRRFHGTGLGLTIVKQLVEAMRGTVTVESDLSKGCTFTVAIPVDPARCVPWTFVPTLARPKVVIVDRESYFRSSFEIVARQYRVGTVGIHLRDPLLASALDLQCRDAGLIIVSGEATQSDQVLRFIRANRGLPFVIMLRPSDVSLRHEVETLSVAHIVHQPIITDDIFQVVASKLPSFDQSLAEEKLGDFTCGRKLRVLIADDSPSNRTILDIVFGEAGHDVVTVQNGRELVDTLRGSLLRGERAFDLIVTDVQMPEMDGIEAVREIRNLEREYSAPANRIISLSGHVFPEEIQGMLDSGSDAVIKKPISFDELLETVLKLVGASATSEKTAENA